MTTPRERMRALRWGWELLDTLQHDELLSPALANRARDIVQRYPTPSTLIELLKSESNVAGGLWRDAGRSTITLPGSAGWF